MTLGRKRICSKPVSSFVTCIHSFLIEVLWASDERVSAVCLAVLGIEGTSGRYANCHKIRYSGHFHSLVPECPSVKNFLTPSSPANSNLELKFFSYCFYSEQIIPGLLCATNVKCQFCGDIGRRYLIGMGWASQGPCY